MYLYDKNRITYFAETDRRNKRVPFGIKAEDRTRHVYIIGKTGMGKSTLIENLVVQDIKNGEGVVFIDPHGKSAALLLDYIPPERVKDVVYFAPFDSDYPISFNVMEDVGPDKRNLVANGLMSAFKKIFGAESFSDRMQYILMNCILALLEYPDSTLLGVNRMLTDKAYRKKVVDNVKDPSVKAYWVEEFAKYTEKFAAEATPAVQNKLGQFTSNPLIRNIIGQPHSSFDLRKMMDERKILIVNLSKGQLGEGNAALLGGMIITKIYLAAMSRADLTEEELKRLPNFYMYVDEFQNFANESFADILSEARKYKLALTVANQYIKQMDEKVADAVFGNVGTQIMFRVGAPDAEELEKEYAPVFTAEDMVSLGFTQIYLKLMIDGVASHPFSAVTLPPIAPPAKSLREEVIKSSRELYGRPRQEVEKSIENWFVEGLPALTSKDAPREPYKPATPAPQGITPAPMPRPAPSSQYSNSKNVAGATPRTIPVQKVEVPLVHSSIVNGQMSVVPPVPPVPSSIVNGQMSNVPPVPPAPSSVVSGQMSVVPPVPPVPPRTFTPAPERAEQSRPQRTEKPFAQAFKGIVIPEPVKKEEVKPISLSSLNQMRPTNRNVASPRTEKEVTTSGMSSLKAALADVIKEKTSQPEEKAVRAPIAQQHAQAVPQSPVVKEENIIEKKFTPATPLRERDLNQRQKPQQNLNEQNTKEQPREVPEDVLTAILRGED